MIAFIKVRIERVLQFVEYMSSIFVKDLFVHLPRGTTFLYIEHPT
jgi:hypothetical protein